MRYIVLGYEFCVVLLIFRSKLEPIFICVYYIDTRNCHTFYCTSHSYNNIPIIVD